MSQHFVYLFHCAFFPEGETLHNPVSEDFLECVAPEIPAIRGTVAKTVQRDITLGRMHSMRELRGFLLRDPTYSTIGRFPMSL